jgi:hypothetical protein
MTGSNGLRSKTVERRMKVAHIRLSEGELAAVEAAATGASMSVSAFVRSLSLEGAGAQPFLNPADRALIQLLGQDMRAVGNNLNQLALAMRAGRSVDGFHLAGAVDDARAVATTVAAGLSIMTKQAAAARRGEAV